MCSNPAGRPVRGDCTRYVRRCFNFLGNAAQTDNLDFTLLEDAYSGEES